MRRRSLIKTLFILLLLLAASFGIVGWLLKREPEFYVRENAAAARPEDSVQAGKVVTRISELMDDLRATQKGDWGKTFTAEELNAFFRERESGTNPLTQALFSDLPDPRIAIEGDRLRVAYRHGQGTWSTVIEVEIRMWLVEGESNVVALEIVRFQAGAMPLPKNWLLNDIGAAGRSLGSEVEWYRKGSNPVALCKLYANQNRPETQLTTLKIGDSSFTVAGRHTGPQSAGVK